MFELELTGSVEIRKTGGTGLLPIKKAFKYMFVLGKNRSENVKENIDISVETKPEKTREFVHPKTDVDLLDLQKEELIQAACDHHNFYKQQPARCFGFKMAKADSDQHFLKQICVVYLFRMCPDFDERFASREVRETIEQAIYVKYPWLKGCVW